MADPDVPEDLRVIPISAAAKRLGISPSTAKKWAADGKFPGALRKVGGIWLVNEKALNDFIRAPLQE
jgi:excisionase family DNA binding protein